MITIIDYHYFFTIKLIIIDFFIMKVIIIFQNIKLTIN